MPWSPKVISAVFLVFILAILVAWWFWTRTDRYQAREAFAAGNALAAASAGDANPVWGEWFQTAVLYETDDALAAARSITKPEARNEIVSGMAKSLAASGEYRAALSAASELRDPVALASALTSMAGALTGIGKSGEGKRAAELATEQAMQRLSGRVSEGLYSGAAAALATLGMGGTAISAIERIDDPATRAAAALRFVQKSTETESQEEIRRARDMAIASALAIADTETRCLILLALAPMMAQHMPERISEALQQASNSASQIPDTPRRVERLILTSRVAEEYGQTGIAAEAAKRAFDTVRLMPDAPARSAALAQVLPVLQRPEDVDMVVQTALELPDDVASRPRALAAAHMARSGRLRQARLMAERSSLPADRVRVYRAVLQKYMAPAPPR